MDQTELRELYRRQHKVVSLFAVIQCWVRHLDGVVFEGAELRRLLRLGRLTQPRVKWLREDLREMFPYQELCKRYDLFHSLFASRDDLKDFVKTSDVMTTDQRLQNILKGGIKMQRFEAGRESVDRKAINAFANAIPERLILVSRNLAQ